MQVSKEELSLGGWLVSFTTENDNLTFTVTFADNSNVSCIEEISRSDEDFGERYTSQTIEDYHNEHGDSDGVATNMDIFTLDGYVISMYVDYDHHLNIWVEHEGRALPVNTQGEFENPSSVITRNF